MLVKKSELLASTGRRLGARRQAPSLENRIPVA
jgi:hypothetical protein